MLNLDLQGPDQVHFFTNVFGNLSFFDQTELRALWEALGFFKVRESIGRLKGELPYYINWHPPTLENSCSQTL